MDWQLRLALIIAGCALVAYVYYDYSKKKKIQKENEKLKQKFSNISENVDSAGFDHVGVGSPRPATNNEDKQQADLQLTDKGIPLGHAEGTSVEEFIEKSLNSEKSIVGSDLKSEDVAEQSSSNSDYINEQPAGTIGESNSRKATNDPEPSQPEKAMVLSLLLQAPQGSHFKGKDFLPLFLSQGLRHGELGIFHRRTRAGKDPGPVLFSLANGIAPGTFDINNMENFETPALACFVTLPGPDDAQVAYNAMYKTCLLLQQELGGELLDETKSVYSKQTHNHRLDQIKDYSFKFGS